RGNTESEASRSQCQRESQRIGEDTEVACFDQLFQPALFLLRVLEGSPLSVWHMKIKPSGAGAAEARSASDVLLVNGRREPLRAVTAEGAPFSRHEVAQ